LLTDDLSLDSLLTATNADQSSVTDLKLLMCTTQDWYTKYRLLLNAEKTAVQIVGIRVQLAYRISDFTGMFLTTYTPRGRAIYIVIQLGVSLDSDPLVL